MNEFLSPRLRAPAWCPHVPRVGFCPSHHHHLITTIAIIPVLDDVTKSTAFGHPRTQQYTSAGSARKVKGSLQGGFRAATSSLELSALPSGPTRPQSPALAAVILLLVASPRFPPFAFLIKGLRTLIPSKWNVCLRNTQRTEPVTRPGRSQASPSLCSFGQPFSFLSSEPVGRARRERDEGRWDIWKKGFLSSNGEVNECWSLSPFCHLPGEHQKVFSECPFSTLLDGILPPVLVWSRLAFLE